ncbi:MAG: serine/threonine-protein kinase [Cyanobacteria bacterium REEB67]|nr:serine/threonine-protein kinase [Cyanobacteria bacterium REEB67]
MKVCPECGARFETVWAQCPHDGALLRSDKPDPLIGTTFAEHYEILSVLGRGGMSVVYKAKHRLMNRVVAIKLLHGDADQIATERFRHEAQAASSLSHPNIISIYEFGIAGDQPYLIMDCLEGSNLGEVLQAEKHLGMERAINIFRQTCLGLEHAHKNGVIHRDLKPSNLCLVTGEGGAEIVKIVDFGIAKLMPEMGREQTRLTQTGEVFGSPLYMSPEQCRAKPLDTRSDIYSLGCLMYECLTGVLPIEGDTSYETMTMHISKLPEPFIKVAPHLAINRSIEAIVFRCLEKDPADRYQSVSEIIADLPTVKAESGSIKVRSVQHPAKARREIKVLRYSFWSLFVFVAAVLAYISCDNGSSFDRGTVLDKTMWNAQTTIAQSFASNHMYEQAKFILLDSEQTARRKFSNKGRLLTVLNMERIVFEDGRMFEDLEAVNRRIAETNNEILLNQYAYCMDQLDKASAHTGDTSLSINKILAPITIEAISHISRALVGNGLIMHAEKLTARTKDIYTKMLGASDPLVGDVDLMLAEIYWRQQRLSFVEPLLKDAEAIFQKSLKPNDKRIALAWLRLGELYRDRNRYPECETALEAALAISTKYYPTDTNLQYQCYNAYGCYLDEVNKSKEAAEAFAKADKLKPTDLIED